MTVEADIWGIGLGVDNVEPAGLRVRMETGLAREMEDKRNDIDRYGTRIEVVDDSPVRVLRAYLPVLQEIGLDFDIPPSRQPLVWLDNPDDPDFSGRYPRYFGGYAKRVVSGSEAGLWERELAVECADFTILLDEAPTHPSTAYPPGDGTPYVYTRIRQSITVGANTVRPDSMRDVYAGKYLYLGNPAGTNTEQFLVTSVNYTGNTVVAAALATIGAQIVTPASMTGITLNMWLHTFSPDGTGSETVQVTAVTATTFTATYTKKKRANWIVMAGEFTATLTATKTYSTTTVATGISKGVRVVTPASMTNITAGQILTVHNADNTAKEDVEVLEINNPAGTFKAEFTTAKNAAWVVSALPILEGGISDVQLLKDGWQQDIGGVLTLVTGVFDTFYNRSESCVVAGAISAGNNQSINPANMRNIFTPRTVWCENADGTNGEEVVVESVLGGSFTADFTLAKSAGWLVYNGLYIDKAGIAPIISSLPHMQWGRDHGDTVRDIIEDLANSATPIDATSTTAVTAGNNIWVTPSSMYGISLGKKLRLKNADGSGSEVVEVEEVDLTRFRADYTSNKSGTWIIRGDVKPCCFLAPLQDSPDHLALWTPQANWVDTAAYTTRTDLDLIDAQVLDDETQAGYTMYSIERNEYEKVNAADVRGSNNAVGSYTHQDDLDDDEGPVRIIRRRAIDRPDLFTTSECDEAARRYVLDNFQTRESYVVETNAQLQPNVLRQFMTTSFTSSKDPETTPVVVPILRPSLSFPEGFPLWRFNLGAPIFGYLDDTPDIQATRTIPAVDPDMLTEIYAKDADFLVASVGGWNQSYPIDAIGSEVWGTLPPAEGWPGAVFRFKKIDSSINSVYIQVTDGDLIDGAEFYELSRQYQAVEVQSDGVATYNIMSEGRNIPDALDSVATVWSPIGDGVNVITTGNKNWVRMDFDGILQSVTLLADDVGSVVVDIIKSTFGTFPAGDSITDANKPTLTAAQTYLDTALTGWDTAVAAGDILIFEVESAWTVKLLTVQLEVGAVP